MKDERFDLEGELRAGRSQPRTEFATALAGNVRGRVRRSRIGLALALAGLMIVAVASFGGIGYAGGKSSASAQYQTPTTKHQQAAESTQAKEAVKSQSAAATPKTAPTNTSSGLPFTGLALWVPLAIGLSLIAFGVVVRTRARRQRPGAH